MTEENQVKQDQIELSPEQLAKLLKVQEPDTDKKLSLEKALSLTQNAISLVVGLGALVTGTGFIVVNSYLAKFTDALGYNIVPGQYIAAGIGVWGITICIVGILSVFLYSFFGKFTDKGLRKQRYKLSYGLASVIAPLSLFTKIPATISLNLLSTIVEPFSAVIVSRITAIILIAISSVIAGWLYGNIIYGHLPRFLGGGEPTTMTLVLKKDVQPTDFGLTPNSQQNQQTSTLLLLANLTDGLLVADTNNGQVTAIKDEMILGIVDDVKAQWVITPTPTPTSTPTETPVPTATP